MVGLGLNRCKNFLQLCIHMFRVDPLGAPTVLEKKGAELERGREVTNNSTL